MRARDFVRRLDVVHLDVDHADAELDARIHLAQRVEVLRRAVRHFQHQVVGVQLVEERDQRASTRRAEWSGRRSCRSRNAPPRRPANASSTRLMAAAARGPSSGLPGILASSTCTQAQGRPGDLLRQHVRHRHQSALRRSP